MKKMIKIIRTVDVAKQYERELEVEQDYWLASLSDAIAQENETHKKEALDKLRSISRELEVHRYKLKGMV